MMRWTLSTSGPKETVNGCSMRISRLLRFHGPFLDQSFPRTPYRDKRILASWRSAESRLVEDGRVTRGVQW